MGTPQSGKLSILEIVARLKELSERYGEESEGGKDLDLCRELDLFVTIFWSMRKLSVSRVRVFRSNLFLTDKDSSFIINLTEDEDNPGELLAIYEDLQLRGPGCSVVGECEDLDSSDLLDVSDVVMDTIQQTQV